MRLMLSGILSYLDPMQCGDWWCDTAWVNWMKNIPKYSFVRSSLALQKWAIVIAWDMGVKMQKNWASFTIHSRDLSQDLCEQFLLASGLWF